MCPSSVPPLRASCGHRGETVAPDGTAGEEQTADVGGTKFLFGTDCAEVASCHHAILPNRFVP